MKPISIVTMTMLLGMVCGDLSAQSTSITPGTWDKSGIILIPHDGSSPLFGQLAAALNPTADLSPLFPYSFVLRNNSPRTILVYAARWVTTDARGRQATHDLVEGSNLEGATRASEIAPFSDQLILPISRGVVKSSTASTHVERTLRLYSTKVSTVMSLETVILDDGQVLGTDSGNSAALMRAKIDAHRELASGVLDAWNTGGESAVIQYLGGFATTPGSLVSASRQPSSEDAFAAFLANQRAQYARAYLLIAKCGRVSTLIQTAQKTLDRTPVTIHR